MYRCLMEWTSRCVVVEAAATLECTTRRFAVEACLRQSLAMGRLCRVAVEKGRRSLLDREKECDVGMTAGKTAAAIRALLSAMFLSHDVVEMTARKTAVGKGVLPRAMLLNLQLVQDGH